MSQSNLPEKADQQYLEEARNFSKRFCGFLLDSVNEGHRDPNKLLSVIGWSIIFYPVLLVMAGLKLDANFTATHIFCFIGIGTALHLGRIYLAARLSKPDRIIEISDNQIRGIIYESKDDNQKDTQS